jgi:hypothetical protein
MNETNDTTSGNNERRGKRGPAARVWTPEERDIIETWEGSVPKLAKALGCSVGKAYATLKACEEVAP